jgi:hypothetical protein
MKPNVITKQKMTPGSFGALPLIYRKPNSDGSIVINNKNLTSLEGCPEKVDYIFTVSGIPTLTSLVNGPKEVGGIYSVIECGLTSLDGIPSKIGDSLYIGYNHLTSLQGINQLKEMNGEIYLDGCPITSHLLGVFFIKGCYGVSTYDDGNFGKAADIVNRHIDKGRAGLLPCQKELIEAGLADFAQI